MSLAHVVTDGRALDAPTSAAADLAGASRIFEGFGDQLAWRSLWFTTGWDLHVVGNATEGGILLWC